MVGDTMSGMKVSKEADNSMTGSRATLLSMMTSCVDSVRFGSPDHVTYGQLYSRMRDIVLLLPSLSKDLQKQYAMTGCFTAIEMVSNLVRTDETGCVSLYSAMLVAFGSYVEQEGKKGNQWAFQSYGDLYKHLSHEIVEIKRSVGSTVQLHNAMDAVGLFAMLAIKIGE